MFDEVRKNPWVRAGAAAAALALVLLLMYLLRPVLVSLFFAFLLAYLLDPVVDFFERLKISRSLTIACFAMIAIVLMLAIPLIFIPSLIHQADRLITAAEAGMEDSGGVSGWIADGLNRLPLASIAEATGCSDGTTQAAPEITTPVDAEAPATAEAAPETAAPSNAETSPETETSAEGETSTDALADLTRCFSERIKAEAVAFFQAHGASLASAGASAGMSVGRLLASIGGSILGGILFLGNVALFAFVAAYLLKDYDSIVAASKELVPKPYREKVLGIAAKVDLQVRSFVRGQLVVCLCLGLVYAIGFGISGVPFGLLIAIFGAVANFIPYLGLALTIGPSVILVIVQYGGVDWHLGAVAATFVVAQLLEGTVLTPMIVGDKVGLSPVWVILAILVFGNALGFLGLLLAVPIAASLKVLVVEAVEYYKASPVFQGPGPET